MLWELTETSGVLGGWGGGFVGVHEIFFGGGGGEVNRLKRGVWIVCRFTRRIGKRRGHVFKMRRG